VVEQSSSPEAGRAAVLAVVGCTLLVSLLVTWAASIGPDKVLEGKGADLITITGTGSASAPTTTSTTEALESPPPPSDAPLVVLVIAVVVESIVVGLLLVALFLGGRHLWRRRGLRRREPEVEVDFDVIEAPRAVAEAMTRDADEQRLMLLAGDPRNAIVECWNRFEVQAAWAGVARRAWETPAEHTLRILDLVDADEGAVSLLAARFREARFSEHAVTEEDRQRAVDALDRIHATLLSRPSRRS